MEKRENEYTTPGEGFKYNLQEICKEVVADLNKELLGISKKGQKLAS